MNSQGLHARPADLLVKLASNFQAKVEVHKNGEAFDAKSILSILTLAAVQGTRLELRACGPDAEEAVRALADLFDRGFDEEPRLNGKPAESPQSEDARRG